MKQRRKFETNMNKQISKNDVISQQKIKRLIIKFLVVILIFGNFIGLLPNLTTVLAQQPIIITSDQPNIWTLEQAHYLLAQMHRRNLDLKATNLTNLDANEINGINIDVLKTMLEVSASFDEKTGFENGLAKKDKTFNSEQRQKLIERRNRLNDESLALTRVIARLNREKELADNETDKKRIELELAEKNADQAATDKQIAQINEDLKTLNAQNNTLTSPTPPSSSGSGTSQSSTEMETAFRNKAAEIINSFKTNPQLNASLKLDNYLQLQYEIISKQLTLLRDEVGPGERLIFLELPQSINASYDRANKKWAQSRWNIKGYTRCGIELKKTTLKTIKKTVIENGVSREIDEQKPDVKMWSVPCEKILGKSITERNNRPAKSFSDFMNNIDNIENSYFFSVSDVKSKIDLLKRLQVSSNIKDPIVNKIKINFDGSSRIALSAFTNSEISLKTSKEAYFNKLIACNSKTLDDSEKATCEAQKIALSNALAEAEGNSENARDEAVSLIISELNEIIDGTKKENFLKDFYFKNNNSSERNKIFTLPYDEDKNIEKLFKRLKLEEVFSKELNKLSEGELPRKFFDLDAEKSTLTGAENRQVRVVDMIPRQSSLNINDVKLRNSSSAFNFLASWLWGFGANVSYRREREQYSQFVQQELYSAAFGKGSREFGWTFTPMPGMSRLSSGVRTTYAIVIVPQEAQSIVMESTGCFFSRSTSQPKDFKDAITENWQKVASDRGCSGSKKFEIPIPGGGFESSNDFNVSGLRYDPVAKGERITVSIYGSNFSSQIGMMINGSPLPPSLGVAQPFIRDDSSVASSVITDLQGEKVKGRFERVDSSQIVASFEMPATYEKTPTITLVAPGKAVEINSLDNIEINGIPNTKLKYTEWMFGTKPKIMDFVANEPQIFRKINGDMVKRIRMDFYPNAWNVPFVFRCANNLCHSNCSPGSSINCNGIDRLFFFTLNLAAQRL
jgi:ribosomal protein S8